MKIVLTNMCMVYNQNNEILVMNRTKSDWPGLTFPGGHIEEGEDYVLSTIREVKEETGLNVTNLVYCGKIEWKNQNYKDVCLIYKTSTYQGELKSSYEGEVFWLNKDNLDSSQFSVDFDKILEICLK